MIKYKYIKTLTAGVALASALYPQAWAIDCSAGYLSRGAMGGHESCFPASGSCGTNCSYRMDEDGNLFISGQNAILSSVPINQASAEHIYISEGIIEIKSKVFAYQDVLKSINIPESATVIGDNILFVSITRAKVYCTSAQVNNGLCTGSKLNSLGTPPIAHYEKDGDKYIVYDSFDENKQIVGIYDDSQNMQKDIVTDSYEKENEQTGHTEVFNGRGVLTYAYAKNPDGSTSIYDTNGKLTGLKNAKSITPAQAAALVKKGNHNRVTLTFK